MEDLSRRKALGAIGMAGMTGLAGCSNVLGSKKVAYGCSGGAVNPGESSEIIKSSALMAEGDSSVYMHVIVYDDGIPEGKELALIRVEDPTRPMDPIIEELPATEENVSDYGESYSWGTKYGPIRVGTLPMSGRFNVIALDRNRSVLGQRLTEYDCEKTVRN